MTAKGTHNTFYQPPENSYNKVMKEGGYDNFQQFMHSHNLKMYDDDDIQLGKEILSRYEEHDRARADDRSHTSHVSPENKPTETNTEVYDSDSDSDSPSGVRLGYYEDGDNDEADSDDAGCRLDAANSYFDWGVDEPEFEDYPAFSDGEEGFGQGNWNDEVDYGDGGDYGDHGRDGCDGCDGYDGEAW
ncbi:hypothetical protein BDW66DRAFT_149230 [Aspergillus desertorum]